MTDKPEYVKIEDIPKSKRGQREIPKEWTETVKRTPVGQAIIEKELKYSTAQGRVRNLIQAKKLDETYFVMQRKVGNKAVVYIAHKKPEKAE